jgi:signal transduction histidine kinase
MTVGSVTSSQQSDLLAQPLLLRLMVFGALHLLLVGIGFWLRVEVPSATIFWPAQGWLFAVLWISQRRTWPGILVAALVAEIVGALWFGESQITLLVTIAQAMYFALANLLGAIAGVWLAQRTVLNPMISRSNPVPAALAGAVVAAGTAAVFGAFGLVTLGAEGGRYYDNWLLWSLGDLVGILAMMPVVVAWGSRLLGLTRFPLRVGSLEFVAIAAATLLVAVLVFGSAHESQVNLFAFPYVVLIPLVWAVMRLPPRYAMTLLGLLVMIAATGTHYDLGPFAREGSLALYQLLPVQTFLSIVCIACLLLGQAVNERLLAEEALTRSESRYRNYVELSSEPLWRVELRPTISVQLPPARQLQLIGERGYFAECSRRLLVFARDSQSDALFRKPLHEHPWYPLLTENWPTFVRAGYRIDGLEWQTRGSSDQSLALYVSFVGVVENGELCRLWGVARDITELKETQAALERERELLQEYAALLVSAEERARRTTAIDLHDGLAQLLVAAKMRLQGLKRSAAASPEAAPEIDAIEDILEDASASTRGVIADLSPPGLYELGLPPAMRWLAEQMESRHDLQVGVRYGPGLENLSEDLRVTAFRVTRELLNNVVRHAGVKSAAVSIERDDHHLQVIVEDNGRGFDPEAIRLRDFGPGFGLFSVRDQVRHSGGALTIQSRPGQGTRVSVRLPLAAARPATALAS